MRLGAQQSGDEVTVFVEDDGPGVAPADRPRLFTAFDRLGQQNLSHSEGTGLGLALSKSLVESMGGTLDYTPRDPSGRDPGARFWFTLSTKPASTPAKEGAQ